jgi:hypothetical protein
MPEVPGAGKPLMSLRKALWRGRVVPRQRAERLIAGAQPSPRDSERAFDSQVQVARKPELDLAVMQRLDLP